MMVLCLRPMRLLSLPNALQGALLVGINKMDVKGADADKVKTQMQERSIPSEDWGGDVVTVPISALQEKTSKNCSI